MTKKTRIGKKSIKMLSMGLVIPVVYNAYITIENGKLRPTDITMDTLKIEKTISLDETDEVDLNPDNKKYETIADIPTFYRDQIVKQGIKESTRLDKLYTLNLDVDNSSLATWLSECQNLHTLHINFLQAVDANIFAIYKDLPHLTDLTISTTKTESFTNASDWQNNQQKYYRIPFSDLYQSYYDSNTKKYFNTRVLEILIDPDVFSFLERCPKVNRISFEGFSYGKDTDLSWLKICQNLQTLLLKPCFENFWNLDQMKDIVNALPKLNSLQIKTSSSSITDCDLSLILYLAQYADIDRIEYSGLMPNKSFCYTKEYGKNTFSPGIGDRIDYTTLSNINVIDLSSNGLYNGLIYLDNPTFQYLLSQGLEIKVSPEYDIEYLSKEIAKLDKIYAGLKIADDDTDFEKLVKVLNYVVKTYRYGDTNSAINLKETYYHEGPLYGAMKKNNIICGNFASMTCTLLERANIEAYYIENRIHAWVLVKIDDAFYYFDPTFLNANYKYYIGKGYQESIALKKTVESKKFLIDPYSIITVNISPTEENLYTQAKIPFWIEQFSAIYERKDNVDKNLTL